MKKILSKIKVKLLFLVKFINELKLFLSKRQFKKLKNIYDGKRCFIIGNGPSLKIEDLEKLKGEICFGTHQIFKIFKKTDWRPTYYCAQDFKLIKESFKQINKLKINKKFIAVVPAWRYKLISNATYIKLFLEDFYPSLPKFSTDISKGIYEGYTVTYMCIQIAVYMGFKEIYLLGMDNNYSVTMLPNGEIQKNENIKDHFSLDDKITNIPQIYKSSLAYKKAKEYADKNGIMIYNATRGGALEVFKRVNFDDIVQ